MSFSNVLKTGVEGGGRNDNTYNNVHVKHVEEPLTLSLKEN